jgi:hypothetical protein
MEKITLKALQLAGFQNADMIAKIISYVPNPQVATEMLLGIYEEKHISIKDKFRKYRYNRENMAEILRIDELGDTVTYHLHEQFTQQAWFVTKEDYDNSTNPVLVRPAKYHDYRHIPATGFTTKEVTEKLSQFNDNWCTKVLLDDAIDQLDQWRNYGLPEETNICENELPF